MAQNRRARVLGVEKLVEEEMDRHAKRPECKVPDEFGKVECSECDREGEVGECGLLSALFRV
jgi:hypothetical protein